jgi:uncharacterized protein
MTGATAPFVSHSVVGRRRGAVGQPASAEAVQDSHRRAAPWPYVELDMCALRDQGWRPTPVRELVLKVHQRCNLACDYCYVYMHADQSWRDRPDVMPDDVWRAVVDGLGRHVRKHALPSVRVVLHGGEPLLLGPARISQLAADLRAEVPADCRLDIGLQTNGVLLNEAMAEVLRQQGITVGVSVDGTQEDHDRHRFMPNGRGSFAGVRGALDLLRREDFRTVYAGLLCTVSPDADPIATYEQLLEFEPPVIDFLLPHANWEAKPWRWSETGTPYADWLITVFDRWYGGDGVTGTRVRLFEDVITMLIGGSGRSEQAGLSPNGVLVVESDGAIELVDALKTAYPGACATGLDIRRDELDDALADPGVVARQIGTAALSDQCGQCPVMSVCGGGHYAHRYRAGVGFRNPTVYCRDMLTLIQHVRARVAADVQKLAERRNDRHA